MMETPVLELLRVSTESQRERLGLPAQQHANAETCKRFGLRIVESVQIVMSGTEVAEAPEMQRLLAALEAGRASGIVVAAYDRLFRPEKWSDMLVLQRIQDAGASIYTPAGPIDLSTDLGHMQATLYNLFASMERKRIRERMETGREEKRRRGEHVGFKCSIPFGLDWTKETGWIYTPEIEVVRALFRRFLAGEHSYTKLADQLGLARTTARFVLQNEVYTGWRVYDEKRDPTPAGRYASGDRRRIKRPEHQVIRVRLRGADGTPLVPVVSREQFDVVQAIIERGRLNSARARGNTEGMFVYRGVLYCSCGEICYCTSRGKYNNGTFKGFYHCRTRCTLYGPPCGARYMSLGKLESILDRRLVDTLTDREFFFSALGAYEEQQGEAQPEVDASAIHVQIERLESRRRRVLEIYEDGIISKTELKARLERIDEEQARYASLMEDVPQEKRLDLDGIFGALAVFAEWPRLAFDDKRSILTELAPRIYVRNYNPLGIWFDEAAVESASVDADSLSKKVTSS